MARVVSDKSVEDIQKSFDEHALFSYLDSIYRGEQENLRYIMFCVNRDSELNILSLCAEWIPELLPHSVSYQGGREWTFGSGESLYIHSEYDNPV